jgi:hypothetical protein
MNEFTCMYQRLDVCFLMLAAVAKELYNKQYNNKHVLHFEVPQACAGQCRRLTLNSTQPLQSPTCLRLSKPTTLTQSAVFWLHFQVRVIVVSESYRQLNSVQSISSEPTVSVASLSLFLYGCVPHCNETKWNKH